MRLNKPNQQRQLKTSKTFTDTKYMAGIQMIVNLKRVPLVHFEKKKKQKY